MRMAALPLARRPWSSSLARNTTTRTLSLERRPRSHCCDCLNGNYLQQLDAGCGKRKVTWCAYGRLIDRAVRAASTLPDGRAIFPDGEIVLAITIENITQGKIAHGTGIGRAKKPTEGSVAAAFLFQPLSAGAGAE